MKKLFSVLLLLPVLFTACEGPEGPPGFDGLDGLDGLDGVNILGQVIEIQGDFTAANDYKLIYEFPNSVEVFETDVVLTYILWEVVDDTTGGTLDVWRLLPQTLLLNQGILQYNYDFTFVDVNIFLDANFDLATLTAGDTQDQVFRIAIVPADAVSGGIIDPNNLGSILGSLKIEENEIKQIQF